MNDNGYVKLYRKTLSNPIVCKDSDHLAIWCYLLLNATHREIKTIFKGEKITLLPGQLITGRKVISGALKIDESKTQRVLSCFESEHQIEQQTSNKNRLISILNWEEYQSSEQQMNNKCTTNEQQVNTNKNVNNVRSNNNIILTTTTTIYSYIEDNFSRTLSPIEIECIDKWLLLFKEDAIKYAIKIAVFNNKKTFKYVDGILKNWKSCNYTTLQEIKDAEKKRKDKKGEKVELFDYDWLNDSESYENE